MAHFEQHCTDCKVILGNRHDTVNRWIDSMFWKKGSDHRRYYHHSNGVRLAGEKFGAEGAKAAIVHIVRDYGRVPLEREYYEAPEGIEAACGFVNPPCKYEQFFDEFRAKCLEEIKRILGR